MDRAAALVEERRSQVCLGLDPLVEPGITAETDGPTADLTSESVLESCISLMERAGPSCVAVKPQLASFERLGWRGFRVLEQVCLAARELGLMVIADGKRGDVPVSARAYADALTVEGLGSLVDAFTVNPFTGADSIEPFVEAAERSGSGIFVLVRTSNPGAADFQDLVFDGSPLFEHVARVIERFAGRLEGSCGLSGMGAVVGATEPAHLGQVREILPKSIFLIPGVGAQGGRPEDLAEAFASGRASALVNASRSIAGADDPALAAEELRKTLWEVSGARS
ncbi:MAG: orotidine-5'-phosphate decarboxylase, partial [Solirubrobacterales bacterium]